MATVDFDLAFQALSGEQSAYPWQRALFDLFRVGQIPKDICLPTGSGKTSVIPIWLLALASGAHMPRRLVWVVNRRVVVDQATDELAKLAHRMTSLPALEPLRNAVGALSISTLRGERADNGDWSADPSQAAAIVGTVDMIGSRLLFSGYGDGRWRAPQHAGLLACDALIVLDEAHLTPAFWTLLQQLAVMQRSPHGLRIMSLTATPRGEAETWPPSLQSDLATSATFRKRFEATKRLVVVDSKRPLTEELIRYALEAEGGPRRIVFVRSPEDALTILSALKKKSQSERIELMTGTMRGFERDALLAKPVFKEFLGSAIPSAPCWLVATSAAEVGVNLTSDVIITDLDTADHLIQRFGRLNRFGETQGVAYLLVSERDKKDERKSATLAYLSNLSDIRCQTFFANPAPEAAQSETPPTAGLDDRLVDLWAMTSVRRCDARPEVHPWLHGKQQGEPPRTEIAWRADVEWLAAEGVESEARQEALRQHRLLSHEKLHEPSRRAQEKLSQLDPARRVLIIRPDSIVEAVTLGEAAGNNLRYCTVLLPPGCGGLQNGMLSCEEGAPPANDVADLVGAEPRFRFLAKREGEVWRLQRLGVHEPSQLVDRLDGYIVPIPSDDDEDAEPDTWLVYRELKPTSTRRGAEVPLDDHLRAVAAAARSLAQRLGMEPALVRAFELAGAMHDLGKARSVWQEAVGGSTERPLAKSRKVMKQAQLAGFRHELASVMDALSRLPSDLDPASRDLVLHLIAAHHGWARPHFPTRAWDRGRIRKSEQEALEATQRYGRLQARWGPWGLAYLEAVFKSADALVSTGEEEMPEYA